MKPVDDHSVLEQLNSTSGKKPVTDPALLRKLEGESKEKPSALKKTGKAVLEGFLTSGGSPIGAMLGGAKNAMGNIDEAVGKGAYAGGGMATDVMSRLGASPEHASQFGFGTNVMLQSLPVLAGGGFGAKAGGAAAKSVSEGLERGGKELMQSALKPTKADLRTGKAAKAIQTMLDEGVNVTPGGVAELKLRIDALNREIQSAIANSTETIDKKSVAVRLGDALRKFEKQVTPQSDIATIKAAFKNFMDNPLLPKITPAQTVPSTILNAQGKPAFTTTIPASGTEQIPVQLAQELKQGTYRALGDKSYGELKGADIEAQKALARGLKEEIAKAVPGIDKLNAKESELLNAETIAVSRVLMDANKNPMGLGWLAAHPATWIGFAADRSPLIKSLLARAAYSSSKHIPESLGRAVGAGTGAGFARMIESTRQEQPRP